MGKVVKQFRYYADYTSEDACKNYPTSLLTKDSFVNGTCFTSYYPIIQIGIQAIPGTKFNLNNNLSDVIISPVGIYELDLSNSTGSITSLKFDEDSLTRISELPNAYLIVDIAYEED